MGALESVRIINIVATRRERLQIEFAMKVMRMKFEEVSLISVTELSSYNQ